MNNPIELIVDVNAQTVTKGMTKAFEKTVKDSGIELKMIPLDSPSSMKSKGESKKKQAAKFLVSSKVNEGEIHPWDLAQMVQSQQKKNFSFTEPDMDNIMVYGEQKSAANHKSFLKSPEDTPPDTSWDPDWMPHENRIWHLDDRFSQLGSAQKAVDGLNTGDIRIAHFDTGFDGDGHITQPPNLELNLQHCFRKGEDPTSAADITPHVKTNMPGHGTATLALLAGNKIKAGAGFNDFIGGAPFAKVVPMRISNCVVLDGGITTIFKTSSFYAAMRYMLDLHDAGTAFHVLSMSMGGVAAKSWADVVNEAYEKGITLVTAAGNNFGGFPTRHLVYPARFNRVLAAAGVTFEYKPYYISKITEMQGNYGPEDLMDTAISAFTPNTPWALMGTRNLVSFSGAGTSSATPQVAATAACIWKKFKPQLDALSGWQKVEAVRKIMFDTARTNFAGYSKLKFGMGVIQANDAVSATFPNAGSLKMAAADKVRSFYIDLLSGMFKALPTGKQAPKIPFDKNLLNLELTQLIQQDMKLEAKIESLKIPKNNTRANQKKIVEQIIESRKASNTLKLYLKGLL
ncbi:MAG: S8/S53 family peptidase [Ferruginibacter sp.]